MNLVISANLVILVNLLIYSNFCESSGSGDIGVSNDSDQSVDFW